MTYDGTPHEVTVTVSAADDGTLSTSVDYGKEDATSLTVTNTYDQPDATAALSVSKAVSATPKGSYTGTDNFTFTLAAAENESGKESPMPSEAERTVTVTNGRTGNFGSIRYTEAGTYKYTITETVPENKIPGMTYDGTPHEVTVTVSAADDGTLSTSVDYGKEDATSLTVTNTYDQPDATAALSVSKAVSATPKGSYTGTDNFTFTLAAAENESGKESPMPSEAERTVTVTNGRTGNFGSIRYTEAGTYKYTITETVPENKIPGMTYDGTPHEVTVTVSAADDGTLSTSVDYGKEDATSLTVTNTYDQPDATAALSVSKAVSATPKGSYTGTDNFTFTLAAAENESGKESPMPSEAERTVTVTNGRTGNFGSIRYTEAGTYKYTITETVPENKIPGMTYDGTPHEVTVTVSAADDGTLSTSVDYGTEGCNKPDCKKHIQTAKGIHFLLRQENCKRCRW